MTRALMLLLLLSSCADDLSEQRRVRRDNEDRWAWRLDALRTTAPTLHAVPASAPEALRAELKDALRALEAAATRAKEGHDAIEAALAKGRRTQANLVIAQQDRLVTDALNAAESSMARALASVRELPSTENTDDLAVLSREIGAGTELDFVFTSAGTLDTERSKPDLDELERWARFCRGSGKLELIAFVQGSEEELAVEKRAAIDDAVDRMNAPRPVRRGAALRKLLFGARTRLPVVREGPTERRLRLGTERLGAVTQYLRQHGVPVAVIEKQSAEFADLDRPMSFAVAVLNPCSK